MRKINYRFRAELVDSLVMQARISIAMHRIVEPFDADAAEEYRLRAHELAYSAGLNAPIEAPTPCLVRHEPILLDGWQFGQTMAEEACAAYDLAEPEHLDAGLPF